MGRAGSVLRGLCRRCAAVSGGSGEPDPGGTGTLDIQWQPAEAYVVDNGHTIQVDVAEGSSITLEGRRFSLLQFHFHLPSEHMVDGDGFPMEVHFVHQAAEGDLAVVGVFMGTGESHPAIERIWGAIPGSGEPVRDPPGTGSAHAAARGIGLFPLRRLPDHASVFRNGKLGGDDPANFNLASACRRFRGSSSHERAPDSGAQPAIHSVPAVGEQPPHTPSPPTGVTPTPSGSCIPLTAPSVLATAILDRSHLHPSRATISRRRSAAI